MKNIFFVIFVIMLSVKLPAQLLFFDNFDSYAADSKLVQQGALPEWQLWSGGAGTIEDPLVSTTVAYSGLNSVKIAPNNDLVLNLSPLTTGRYVISFFIYVATGKKGYFNILNKFAGANSIWAFQVFFGTNDTAKVDAGGDGIAKFPYTRGQWHHCRVIIDVDDDFATFFFNNTEIVSWQFSTGAFGTGNLQQFHAVNFYGETGAEFYIDDVEVWNEPASNAPHNFSASYDMIDTVHCQWSSPAGPAPISYVIFANNKAIAQVSDTVWKFINPYPSPYTFFVRAYHGMSGYSHKSNIEIVDIPGYVDRAYVLIEKATGTWCPYCPGAAMGLDQLFQEGHKVAIIAYHYNDPYQTSESLQRIQYYNISSFPTVIFDGKQSISGGSSTQNMYPAYKPVFDKRIVFPSIHTIDMHVEKTGSTTFKVYVTITEHAQYYANPLKLFLAVTESNIAQNWQNQTHLNFVFRKMYPSVTGLNVTFDTSTTFTHVFNNVNLEQTWSLANCSFIAFLQDPVSKEVVQTSIFPLTEYWTVEEFSADHLIIYPNPAQQFIYFGSNKIQQIEIYSIDGKLMLSERLMNARSYDVSILPSGLYFVVIQDEKGHLMTGKFFKTE